MSDILDSSPLLAAAPLGAERGDSSEVLLAALPLLGGIDLARSAAYRGTP